MALASWGSSSSKGLHGEVADGEVVGIQGGKRRRSDGGTSGGRILGCDADGRDWWLAWRCGKRSTHCCHNLLALGLGPHLGLGRLVLRRLPDTQAAPRRPAEVREVLG